MNEYHYESRANQVRNQVTKTSKPKPQWVIWSTISLIWVLLVIGSYSLAHYYIGDIRHQLDQIQTINNENVLALTTKLEDLQAALTENKDQATVLQQQFSSVESELNAVKEQMSLAGNSLDSSADTKQALSERITSLSNELGELRKLIKKLEEAARAY